MTHLFYLALGCTIFAAIALIGSFFSMQTSRATMRRIKEVTHRGKRFRRGAPIAKDAGRRFVAIIRTIRARLGIAEDIALPERMARAGYKGILPVDIYAAARILCPLLGLLVGSLIPYLRNFWMIALPAICYLAPNMILTRLVARRERGSAKAFPTQSTCSSFASTRA